MIGIGLGLTNRRGGAGFSPANQTLFLRSDRGVTLSSGAVSSWTDPDSGVSASQGTSGNRPTVSANAIGSRDALNFAGGKFLENSATNLGVAANSAYTVLCVAKGGNGPLFNLRLSTRVSGSLFFNLGSSYLVHNDGANASSNVEIGDVSATVAASFYSVHRYVGGANNPTIFLNDTQRAITSVGTQQGTESGSTGFLVGLNAALVAWGGLIAELRVVTRAISDAEVAQWGSYVRSYYSL